MLKTTIEASRIIKRTTGVNSLIANSFLFQRSPQAHPLNTLAGSSSTVTPQTFALQKSDLQEVYSEILKAKLLNQENAKRLSNNYDYLPDIQSLPRKTNHAQDVQILDKAQNNVFALNLQIYPLPYKKLADVLSILKQIPSNITTLSLRGNDLDRLANEDIMQLLAAIPSNIKSLDLSECAIGMIEDFGKVLAALPAGIKTLNLKWNGLQRLQEHEFAALLKAIPAGVEALDLGGNHLSDLLGTEQDCDILKNIPHTVTSLKLNGNNLCTRTFYEHKSLTSNILAHIPKSLNQLDLSDCQLHHLFGLEYAHTFAAIPTGVMSLNLAKNSLYNSSAADLALGFSSIPCNVHRLDISANEFVNKSTAELVQVFTALPQHVVNIRLSFADIATRSEQEIILLGASFCHTLSSVEFVQEDGALVSLENEKVRAFLFANNKEWLSNLPASLSAAEDSVPTTVLSYLSGMTSKDHIHKQSFSASSNNQEPNTVESFDYQLRARL